MILCKQILLVRASSSFPQRGHLKPPTWKFRSKFVNERRFLTDGIRCGSEGRRRRLGLFWLLVSRKFQPARLPIRTSSKVMRPASRSKKRSGARFSESRRWHIAKVPKRRQYQTWQAACMSSSGRRGARLAGISRTRSNSRMIRRKDSTSMISWRGQPLKLRIKACQLEKKWLLKKTGKPKTCNCPLSGRKLRSYSRALEASWQQLMQTTLLPWQNLKRRTAAPGRPHRPAKQRLRRKQRSVHLKRVRNCSSWQ
mmetsp:Transcript_66148/g.157871  ORF Transcript_66148/g.157871 Transcript_66148/m.157871 type:complete len:254 (+) Transcript_66148:241-1002(+)